ncbi:Helicase [Heracleum sosnowskyi]|uniref:Helicase n=1 Tax=Heracleum sosnowskyi TaxID=360622 RepID=A0AAD8JA45_9APIA|nr:Helicase [Heracleum sosnowskyi]
MLERHNVLVESFRMARDAYKAQPEVTFRLRIQHQRTKDGRQYNIPTASKIAGLIVDYIDEKKYKRDVIVHDRKQGVKKISDLHPSFMAMAYPLIHPYGEDGYRVGIPLRDGHFIGLKRQEVSMCEFYCFRFQQRLNEGHTLFRSGRLLQQYMIDCYMAIEEERFRWIRKHQKELRSELFSGLMDAIHRGDSDSSKVGKSMILPSSHTGGPRYRVQNYQDAMAICKWAGYPDLFITFTCNPKWPEINGMQQLIGQKNDINRVDIICRVFEIKLYQLMQDLRKEQPFGKVTACVYTIEFQKRGLPHAHILLFLDSAMKNPSAEYVEQIISAEIPDINVDPDGYNAVNKFMIH